MVEQSPHTGVSTRLATVLIDAAQSAGQQLSLFLERDVVLRGTEALRVRLEQIPTLLSSAEHLVTALYLAFNGDLEGHVLLAFAPEVAAQMAAALLMEPATTGLDLSEMERSALGEIGNITTAGFLNAVAGACDLAIYPSPPAVIQDMAGALLDAVILDLAVYSTYGLLLRTTFEIDGARLEGHLILLPSADSCDTLERAVQQ